MKKKLIKYIVSITVLGLVLANSIFFRDLDEIKEYRLSQQFDPVAYVKAFWNDEFMHQLHNATDITYLTNMLQTNKEDAFLNYSNSLGIGNIRYFLIKGQGVVQEINEDDVKIQSVADQKELTIATEFIFGNAVRDASGLINIDEFSNTMHFNNISEEINNIIRTEIIPSFRENIQVGDLIEFVGAIELNKAILNMDNIEIIPVKLTITNS